LLQGPYTHLAATIRSQAPEGRLRRSAPLSGQHAECMIHLRTALRVCTRFAPAYPTLCSACGGRAAMLPGALAAPHVPGPVLHLARAGFRTETASYEATPRRSALAAAPAAATPASCSGGGCWCTAGGADCARRSVSTAAHLRTSRISASWGGPLSTSPAPALQIPACSQTAAVDHGGSRGLHHACSATAVDRELAAAEVK